MIEARKETSRLESTAGGRKNGKVLFIQDTTLEGYWVIIVIKFFQFVHKKNEN